MEIQYSKKFRKQYEKTDKSVKTAFQRRLALFLQNSTHPQLHNHQLVGQYAGYQSINITGDWRVLYTVKRDSSGEDIVTFELLGTHSQLYK